VTRSRPVRLDEEYALDPVTDRLPSVVGTSAGHSSSTLYTLVHAVLCIVLNAAAVLFVLVNAPGRSMLVATVYAVFALQMLVLAVRIYRRPAHAPGAPAAWVPAALAAVLAISAAGITAADGWSLWSASIANTALVAGLASSIIEWRRPTGSRRAP
jgi:hypothetical protein